MKFDAKAKAIDLRIWLIGEGDIDDIEQNLKNNILDPRFEQALIEAYQAGKKDAFESFDWIRCKTPKDILVFKDRESFGYFSDRCPINNGCHNHPVILAKDGVSFESIEWKECGGINECM